MVFDESKLVFGSTGQVFAWPQVADVCPDAVVLGGGLFHGLEGGIVVSQYRQDEDLFSNATLPMSLACQSIRRLNEQGGLDSAPKRIESLARNIAQRIVGFEFIRDLYVLGSTIGIETDLESRDLISIAAQCGLVLAPAGPTSIQLQLPVVINDDDQQLLVDRIGELMEILERTAININV